MEILNTFEEMKTTKFLNDRFKEKIQSIIVEFIEGIDTTVPVYSNPKETKAILVSYYSKASALL